MEDVSGIILTVSRDRIGDTAKIEILGKTCEEWVKIALGDSYTASVPYDGESPLPPILRRHVDARTAYTVILYSDTPLVSKGTIIDAVASLRKSGRNILKMTRGFVVRTPYLFKADNLYADETKFFDEEDFVTAFSFRQLSLITDMLKNRIVGYHQENGVHIDDPSTTYIGSDVSIAAGVRIAPNNTLMGKTVIKEGVVLKPGNVIEDTIIDCGATVDVSRLYHSYVGKNTTVGPYAYIRPNCVIGEHCRIGDFVELKNCVIGDESKVSHLSYIGDAELGKNCNVGCGVVFVNYDGKDKHKTRVGDEVFIGSNSNLIAPLEIGDGAFVAAGSTLNGSVPSGALAIARARQVNKIGWTGNKYASRRKDK